MQTYITTDIVTACPMQQDGKDGYLVYTATHSQWISRENFLDKYRPLTRHERTVLNMTPAEAQVAAISGGKTVCTHVSGRHLWETNDAAATWTCKHCGVESFTEPDKW